MSTSERTFHPFSRLPAELRLQIWEQSRESGREVDVRFELREHRDGRHLMSRTPTPAILHTCREARYSNIYRQAFSDVQYGTERSERSYVWVNWDCDIINIGHVVETWDCVHWTYWPCIKRLRFEANLLLCSNIAHLKSCLSLKRITVRCQPGKYRWRVAFPDCPITGNKEVTVGVDSNRIEELDGHDNALVQTARYKPYEEEWSVEITSSFFRLS